MRSAPYAKLNPVSRLRRSNGELRRGWLGRRCFSRRPCAPPRSSCGAGCGIASAAIFPASSKNFIEFQTLLATLASKTNTLLFLLSYMSIFQSVIFRDPYMMIFGIESERSAGPGPAACGQPCTSTVSLRVEKMRNVVQTRRGTTKLAFIVSTDNIASRIESGGTRKLCDQQRMKAPREASSFGPSRRPCARGRHTLNLY